MRDAYDFARYYLKKGADSVPNTYDGNMKLQKLLVLADMAHLSEHQKPLFSDEVLAFRNGPVVENIRLRYRNDYYGFKKDSDNFEPIFSEEEYDTLNNVLGIFGHLSARKLSDLSHTFESWSQAYARGTTGSYHDKKKSVIDFTAYPEDIEAIGRSLEAYKRTKTHASKYEVINGVKFLYDGVELTDDIIIELEEFSRSIECEDDAYSIYLESGELIIW